jgi:hypothetical protein
MRNRVLGKLISSAVAVCFVLGICLVLTAGCQENTKAGVDTCKQGKACPADCQKTCPKAAQGKTCPAEAKKAPAKDAKEAPKAEPKAEAKPAPAPAGEKK